MMNTLIKQLNNPDPEQRKKAIKALAQTKDPSVLKYLATVVKNDDDEEVRDLAVKAGRYIKKQTASLGDFAPEPSSSSSSSWGTASYLTEDDLAEEEQKAALPVLADMKEVSERDKKRAKELVKQALEYERHGDDARAIHHLALALQTNPRLAHDSYTMSIAASATGLSPDEAAQKLLNAKVDPAKKKAKTAGKGEPTWGDALIDLLIYGIAIAGTIGITLVVLLNAVILPAMTKSGQKTLKAPPNGLPIDPSQLVNLVSSRGMIYIVIVAVSAGVYAIINLSIEYIAIHLTATAMLGGEGSLVGLVRKVTLFLAGTYAVMFAGFISAWLLSTTNPSLGSSIGGITAVFTFIASFVFAQRVGSNYQFGIGKGCGTVVIAYIVLVIVFGCIIPLLTSPTPIGQ